jgi:pyrroloquinoline-quinone synthase
MSVLEAIESRIAARHVLDHPFYQAWNAGTLTREALQDYAAQYYHHVSAFPAYLSAVHSNTSDSQARRILLQNLMDEEAGSPNHPELWLQFAEGLGVSRDAVLATPAQPETAALVATFRNLCRSERFTDGVAALYAYESQIPEVSATKIDGLKANYGISDEATLKYFAVHIDADEVHRAQERELLQSHITTEDEAASAVCATEQALDAVWNLLSGVCERHNIACH